MRITTDRYQKMLVEVAGSSLAFDQGPKRDDEPRRDDDGTQRRQFGIPATHDLPRDERGRLAGSFALEESWLQSPPNSSTSAPITQLEKLGLDLLEQPRRYEAVAEYSGSAGYRGETAVRPRIGVVIRHDDPTRRVVKSDRLADLG
jgi:hypothetical protein